MRTLGAILTSSPGKWQVAELDLDAPRQGELMVKLAAAGLCHSDDHIATGDLVFGTYPFCGGHEGAGVVIQVGDVNRLGGRTTVGQAKLVGRAALPHPAQHPCRRTARSGVTALT